MIDRQEMYDTLITANSHGQTIDELCDALESVEDLQAKYAAVVAELECAQNDIELRDREILALKMKLVEASELIKELAHELERTMVERNQ